MIQIFVMVTITSQTYLWTWPKRYKDMTACQQAFVEEVWPAIVPKWRPYVHLLCSLDTKQRIGI